MIFAYIDPGSGSLFIQALIAGALSIPFLFRQRIGQGLRRLRGERPNGPARAESRQPDGPERSRSRHAVDTDKTGS